MRIPLSIRRERGVTLVELLVVIAIILLLLGLVGVVAWSAREKARMSRTKSMLARVKLAMVEYHVMWRDYPSGNPISPTASDPEQWPTANTYQGEEFDVRYLTERDPPWESHQESDRHPDNDNWMADGWGAPFRYRKVSPDEYLIWSVGPNGIDDIGGTSDIRIKKAEDDVTVEDVDY
ncbi:MAG: hypothetical protein AMXMBFR7_42140 [Planctomycetota bacterium]|nr:prepilin-type N-terminal cleavage/methylation domain-containing protein [Planctomycetota bacterium]